MVLHVAANAGQVMNGVDAQQTQVFGGPDAGQQQQLRRSDCPGTQDDFFAFDKERLVVAFNLNPGSPLAFEPDTPCQDIGPDRQVQAMPARLQVGQGRAHPHSAGVVHWECPDSGRLRMVHVLVVAEVGVEACLMESLL